MRFMETPLRSEFSREMDTGSKRVVAGREGDRSGRTPVPIWDKPLTSIRQTYVRWRTGLCSVTLRGDRTWVASQTPGCGFLYRRDIAGAESAQLNESTQPAGSSHGFVPGQDQRQVLEAKPEELRRVRRSRENQEWYQDLVEHSHDLLCVHDLEGHLLLVNPAPARLLGYSVEELLRIPMPGADLQRGLRVVFFCLMAMAGARPSMSSTSGFSMRSRNWRA